jgi:hypothetical protein
LVRLVGFERLDRFDGLVRLDSLDRSEVQGSAFSIQRSGLKAERRYKAQMPLLGCSLCSMLQTSTFRLYPSDFPTRLAAFTLCAMLSCLCSLQ